MTEPLKQLHLRVPVDLHRRVEDFARRSRRSVNAAVVVLLEQALEAEQESNVD